MAPEIIKCSETYTEKVDIWSLGIMMLEFFYGEPPYLNQPQTKVCYLILTTPPPEIDSSKWSPELRDFLKVCLTKDPKLRPSVEDLMQHQFLAETDFEKAKQDYVGLLKKYADSNQIESLFSNSESTNKSIIEWLLSNEYLKQLVLSSLENVLIKIVINHRIQYFICTNNV